MNQKQTKIKNTLKIRSYMDIKKREAFGNQKTGANKLLLSGLRERLANWKLNRLRTRVLKAELGAKLLSGARQRSLQELSSYSPFRNMNRRLILKKGFALVTIFVVIVTAYLQNAPMASAATN